MTEILFSYTAAIPLNKEIIRSTLERVRDSLLRHEINGGKARLNMDNVCNRTSCGTAACIGGWASIFLLGFEPGNASPSQRATVAQLFNKLTEVDGATATGRRQGRRLLHKLFYEYHVTIDHNSPNVAATAIQRYLDGKNPWPVGKMPDVLRYKRKR